MTYTCFCLTAINNYLTLSLWTGPTPEGCNYFYPSIVISNANIVDNITIYDTIILSFELQLQANWNCSNGWCNILKIGHLPQGDPKFPKIAIRPGDLHMATSWNQGKTTYTVDDSVYMDSYNDGDPHLYTFTISPTGRSIVYDNITLLDISGDFPVDNYNLSVNGGNYSLLVNGEDPYPVPNGTVTNL